MCRKQCVTISKLKRLLLPRLLQNRGKDAFSVTVQKRSGKMFSLPRKQNILLATQITRIYFPNSTTYTSGILVPTYGEEQNRGFFLRDGGYYWAAGEYFDLAVRGDIYSRGSWGAKLHTNYKKRYKFSGSFDFKYAMNVYGEQGLDTYNRSPQFQVTWSHSQDQKANPNRTFSASVNFSTSGYDKQNSLSAQNYLRTQKSSSVSYTRKFENTPFNLSMNLRHSQNSSDTTLTLSMPEMTFSLAKAYPFRKKNRSGPLKYSLMLVTTTCSRGVSCLASCTRS